MRAARLRMQQAQDRKLTQIPKVSTVVDQRKVCQFYKLASLSQNIMILKIPVLAFVLQTH